MTQIITTVKTLIIVSAIAIAVNVSAVVIEETVPADNITVTTADLSFWDVTTHAWKAEPGDFELRIGGSSLDICSTANSKLK